MKNNEILEQFKNYTGSVTITQFSDPKVIETSFQGANTTGYFNIAQGIKYIEHSGSQFVFEVKKSQGERLMSININGDIYIRGVFIKNDKEIADIINRNINNYEQI